MDISAKSLWNEVLQRLQAQLASPAFETWIQTTTIVELNKDYLILCAANPFVLNHLQKHYLKLMTEVIEDILGHELEIRWTTPSGEKVPIVEEKKAFINTVTPLKFGRLNPKYTFGRFVVGPTNRLAHAAAMAVAELPGREFNPLFLCGGVGLGKTHLMQAIAHYRLELSPECKIFYVSTEQFTNDLITAIRQDQMQTFREHYRTADVLLVDDIQFIEGKEYTQEEFFHTFNTLHEAGKQVVIASDRPPKRIPTLQDRLISRFSMGLIADIQAPDLETRMAILQKKAEYENRRLSPEVIEYIAQLYTSNIRELEGALLRAVAYVSISGVPMTIDNIAPVLNPPFKHIEASPAVILKVVAENFQISIEDLKSNSRRREISSPRQIGMYLMRQHTDLSLPRIGEEFGGKDHTTVLYSCEKITQLQQRDLEISLLLSQLSEKINLNSRS